MNNKLVVSELVMIAKQLISSDDLNKAETIQIGRHIIEIGPEKEEMFGDVKRSVFFQHGDSLGTLTRGERYKGWMTTNNEGKTLGIYLTEKEAVRRLVRSYK